MFLLLVENRIHNEVNQQQHDAGESPFREHLEEPAERRAFEIKHEQGWVAERCKQAAAVCNRAYEEHYCMGLVFALLVGFYKRTDKQHRRAGGSHYRSKDVADSEKCGVHDWFSFHVPGNVDAAGNDEQRAQEHDERDVVENHLVGERVSQTDDSHVNRDGNAQNQRNNQFVAVALPPFFCENWHERDCKQHDDKGNHCPCRY